MGNLVIPKSRELGGGCGKERRGFGETQNENFDPLEEGEPEGGLKRGP